MVTTQKSRWERNVNSNQLSKIARKASSKRNKLIIIDLLVFNPICFFINLPKIV